MVAEIMPRVVLTGHSQEDIKAIVTGKLRDRFELLGKIDSERLKSTIINSTNGLARDGITDLVTETADYYRKKYKIE
jgi:hypothetical protein